MNILVIGCDQVGASLIRDLEHIGHDISLVEKDPEQLKRLDAFDDYRFGGTALVGDPTDPDVLRRAGVENCDAVAAVSKDDSVNLMAAQIARSIFRKEKVICLVSDPHLQVLYHKAYEIETDTIRQLLSLGGGTASLNEILLPENFQFAGQAVKDIPMPGDAILVCITRDAEFIIPHGNTTLLPWDRILCLTQDDTLHLLMDAWGLSDK